jgi:5-methyltetrahydropteroyltriglutamate--homocysteine methyltransferase
MLETTIAGSLPRPAWLAEPEALKGAWKLSGAELEDGKRRAAAEWIKHQEDAGIDILTDGEQFRTHFVHSFLEHIDGIDQNVKTVMGIRDNRYDLEVPTVTGPVSRPKPVHVDEFKYVRGLTDPARSDDDLRHDCRCALWPARRYGDGLRGIAEPGSARAGRCRRRYHPVR